MPSSCFMLSSFFMSSFFILSFLVFLDFLSFFISSFFICSLFIWSCFMSSCFMLSCFMLSPDCANAASETATRHIATNLPITFFMDPPSLSWNLHQHTAALRWDALVAAKLQVQSLDDRRFPRSRFLG